MKAQLRKELALDNHKPVLAVDFMKKNDGLHERHLLRGRVFLIVLRDGPFGNCFLKAGNAARDAQNRIGSD